MQTSTRNQQGNTSRPSFTLCLTKHLITSWPTTATPFRKDFLASSSLSKSTSRRRASPSTNVSIASPSRTTACLGSASPTLYACPSPTFTAHSPSRCCRRPVRASPCASCGPAMRPGATRTPSTSSTTLCRRTPRRLSASPTASPRSSAASARRSPASGRASRPGSCATTPSTSYISSS